MLFTSGTEIFTAAVLAGIVSCYNFNTMVETGVWIIKKRKRSNYCE